MLLRNLCALALFAVVNAQDKGGANCACGVKWAKNSPDGIGACNICKDAVRKILDPCPPTTSPYRFRARASALRSPPFHPALCLLMYIPLLHPPGWWNNGRCLSPRCLVFIRYCPIYSLPRQPNILPLRFPHLLLKGSYRQRWLPHMYRRRRYGDNRCVHKRREG